MARFCVFCLNPGVGRLTSIRSRSVATRPGLRALACLMSPSQESSPLGSSPSHLQNYSNYRPAPARLEADLLGGVWSLKPLDGNAIWLCDRFMSPRISPLSSQARCLPLPDRYRTRMAMLTAMPYRTKRDPRLCHP